MAIRSYRITADGGPAGRLVLSRQPTDLLALTQHMLQQAQMSTARHTFSLETALACLPVEIDSKRIEQILCSGNQLPAQENDLDAPGPGRATTHSLASCPGSLPGGETMRCQIEQQRQDDPEPAPPGHTSRDGVDQDVGQGGNRQEEDTQQRQEPAAMKGMVH